MLKFGLINETKNLKYVDRARKLQIPQNMKKNFRVHNKIDQFPYIIQYSLKDQKLFSMTKNKNEQVSTKKRHYSNISRSVKEKIIKKVLQQGYSISSASKQYKIKLSTVKAIVSKFKATHEIAESVKERKKRMEKEIILDKHVENYEEREPGNSMSIDKFAYLWNPYVGMWMIIPLIP